MRKEQDSIKERRISIDDEISEDFSPIDTSEKLGDSMNHRKDLLLAYSSHPNSNFKLMRFGKS
jgi:hypothetical protein